MTRNEAVKEIKALRMQYMINVQAEDVDSAFRTSNALGIAITALSGPTREQVKELKGKWEKVDQLEYGELSFEILKCSKCEYEVSADAEDDRWKFCPHCGSPMTDEAVDIVMERLEAL